MEPLIGVNGKDEIATNLKCLPGAPLLEANLVLGYHPPCIAPLTQAFFSLPFKANQSREGLVYPTFRREPVVGVPGSSHPCPAGDHPHLHGPADHGCHRQQEGAQAQGEGLQGSVAAGEGVSVSSRGHSEPRPTFKWWEFLYE